MKAKQLICLLFFKHIQRAAAAAESSGDSLVDQTATSNQTLKYQSNTENMPPSSFALGSDQSSNQTSSRTDSLRNFSTTHVPSVQSQRSPVPSQSPGQSSGSKDHTDKSSLTTAKQTSLASSVQTTEKSLMPSASSSTGSPASTTQPNQSPAKTEATSKPSSTALNHQPTWHETDRIHLLASSKASHQSGNTATPISQPATMKSQDLSGSRQTSANQSPTSTFQRNQADSTTRGSSQSSTGATSPSQSAGSTVPTQESPSGHTGTKTTQKSQFGKTTLGQSQAKETLQSQSPTRATKEKSSWTSTSAAPNSHTLAITMQNHLKSGQSLSPSQMQSDPISTTTPSASSPTTPHFNSSTPVDSSLPGSMSQLPVNDSALNKQMKDEAVRLLQRRRTPGRVKYQ